MPTGLGGEQLWLCPTINNSTDDISGNGNNGTLSGMSINNDADGKHYYQGSSNSDSLTGTFSTPFAVRSISFWVSSSLTGSSSFHMLDSVSGSNKFSDSRWSKRYRVVVDGVTGNYATTYINKNVWHHVVLTYDPNSQTSSVYINGVLDGQTTGVTGTTITDSYEIGAVQRFSRYDDLRAYNRVLTQSEVSWLATERGVLGTPPEGLGDEQLWLCPSIQDGANDLSGNGNNGTYNGGMGTVTDTSNGGSLAYDFDGADDYISNSSLDLRNLPAMSWSAWVKDDKTSGHSSFFSHGLNGQYSNDTYFFQHGGSNQLQVNQSSDGTGSATSPTSSTWNHLAAVFDGSGATNSGRLRYFVNGVEVALSYDYTVPATTGNPSSSSTRIGDYVSAAGFNLFAGQQDDIRVYDRALTPSEIIHLASQRGVLGAPAPQKGLGDEQLWLCPSLEDSANDLSGHNRHGIYKTGVVDPMGTVADTRAGGSRAYDFNAYGKHIDCPTVGSGTTDAFSVSFWLYMNTWPDARYVFDFNGTSSNANDSVTMITRNGNDPRYGIDSMHAFIRPNWLYEGIYQNPIGTGSWFHVCINREAGASNLDTYVNGVKVVSLARYQSDTVSFANGCTIGAFSSGIYQIDGRIDDFRYYSRGLNQAEITHLASSRGVQGHPTIKGLGDEKLWLCPSFNGSANDISGNAKDGTLSGGAAIVSDTGSGGTKSFESYTTSTDSVDIPSGVLSDNSDVSLSVWVKNKQTSAGSRVRNIVRTTNDDLFIYANQTRYRGGAGGVLVQDTLASLNTTGYYHYALNYTQATGTVELFRNGVSIGTTSGAAAITVSGAMDLLQNSVGFVDDVRAYNRVLTPEEIAHLAKSRGVLGSAYNLNGTRHPLTSIYHVIR